MQPEQLILPTIATFALGTALLVPLRDDRLGKRATLGGQAALLRWNFPIATEQREPGPIIDAVQSETVAHDEPAHVQTELETAQESHRAQRVLSELRATASALGARVVAFFAAPPQPLATDASEAAAEPEHHVVAERSFAETLGALLPAVPETLQTTEEAPPSVPESLPAAAPDSAPVAVTPQTFPDRIVPLTRMPLRPQARELTWPRLVSGTHALETPAGRQAFLASAVRLPDAELGPALLAAYREEDAPGRLLALRALRSARCGAAIEIFADALRVGTDEERSFAVDALLEAKELDALTPAFNDRLDAIAAQAALGYVGSHRRADYVTALEPFVDRARIEAILTLLAGIVE